MAEGRIVGIGEGIAQHDYGDAVVFPGLVDSHVHVNEPGRTHWEGFATATRAAVAGGTTTIVDMPLNSIPPTTTLEALVEKQHAARDSIVCDVAFWGGIVPGSEGSVAALENAGVCGFKVFTTDSGVPEFPPMPNLSDLSLSTPLLVHAESDSHLSEQTDGSYETYLASRPPEAEAIAIEALHEIEGRVHVLHVSSAEGVTAISEGGPSLGGETCPHYLLFTAEDVGGTEFKCAPPIRGRQHREALWDALREGVLTMVVSDHSPSPPEMKSGDFGTAWGGIASVQLRLFATWTGAVERGFGAVDMSRWLAGAPAELAGLSNQKGSIEVGKDADLVVFDPDGVTMVRGADLHHRHPLTPYEGMTLRGRVLDTLVGSPARMLSRND